MIGDRRRLIDPTHEWLSVAYQCQLLGLPRSSYYYQPLGESTDNLALMERIDKLFTERPEMGIRRMHQEVSTPDNPINIKRVHRLMRLMGLEAVYQKPNLSKAAEGHQIYPYLLRGVVIKQPDQVWSTAQAALRHYLHSNGQWIHVLVCSDRLVHALHFGLAVEQHVTS